MKNLGQQFIGRGKILKLTVNQAGMSFVFRAVFVPIFLAASAVCAHEGPDPLASWAFDKTSIKGDQVIARLGPDLTIRGKAAIDTQDGRGCLRIDGRSAMLIAGSLHDSMKYLPQQHVTVSAWVAVDRPREWGGIVSAIQDNGNAEKGWLLGYNRSKFYFGVSSEGADDGDGKLTYLSGKTTYERGRLYHVVGVYDGDKMQLYVNGQLDAESQDQSGSILYPDHGEFVLGAYKDDNEEYSHVGRLHEVTIYDEAATAKWVAQKFELSKELAMQPATLSQATGDLAFEIAPYLQYVTDTSIYIRWKTNQPAKSIVRYGATADVEQQQTSTTEAQIHEVQLTGLEPNTQYFYQATSESPTGQVAGEILTFQTACGPETPFAFAIISDTQSNPKVAKQVAEMAWSQRPSFLVHPGDLVGTGKNLNDWTKEFFPSMNPLISRVCIFPVLGNHEQDAKFYYDYMSLPDPEYYYSFNYGNAEFFMVDSNRKLGPGTPQYKWLEKKLAASKATWKFVSHHHPPYSSDENDYGDLWSTNRSTRGDLRIRKTCPLYDKYGVDIVWNGHIHSYERTWPLKDDRPVMDGSGNGTIYMITGGGGGGLETPGPYRPYFQNNVKRGHHYCMAYVNGRVFELKAFDLEGRLFDYQKIEKK